MFFALASPWQGMVYHGHDMPSSSSMVAVALGATLGWQRECHLLAAGLPDDDLLLVDRVGGVDELGNVEALVLNLVLALDLGDGDVLGDTDLLGGRVGKAALDSEGGSDKGDLVGLGLVLLSTILMFTVVWVSITTTIARFWSGRTGRHLHGLGFVFVGDLGGLAVSDDVLPLVDVGADLPLDNSVGLLADGEDTVEAVVVVNNLLHRQGDRGHLLGEGRHAHLSVDGGVGVPAEKLRSMVLSMVDSMVAVVLRLSHSGGHSKSQKNGNLHDAASLDTADPMANKN